MGAALQRGLHLKRAFTVRDLAAVLTGLVIAAGLFASLLGSARRSGETAACTANLHTWFAGLNTYIETYKYFPPHDPYPPYYVTADGSPGWDPAQGFIMQYGMALTPPAKTATGHGLWYVAKRSEYPRVCFCPAMRLGVFDPNDPEVEPTQLETRRYEYAAAYQVSGTCRSATPVVRRINPFQTAGGRNPAIPNPRSSVFAKPANNATRRVPCVSVSRKTGNPNDPDEQSDAIACWIQAVQPGELDLPARVYYMADSRDYRPSPGAGPPAALNDGWISAAGNKVLLGTRHGGFANVMYMDGHVSRENQTHALRWSMDYDPKTAAGRSDEWRAATFATDVRIARIHTQAHIMPQLMVIGWEMILSRDAVRKELRKSLGTRSQPSR